MKTYFALLRGINVGGHGKLSMSDLRLICENIGLSNVRTYIQSGNVIFESDLTEEILIEKLEQAMFEKMQKPVPVIIRTLAEMNAIINSNPFPDAIPAQVGVMFFANKVQKDLLENVIIPGREEVVVSGREIYIHYPDGMGRSKLKLPIQNKGTVRNINTVTKITSISK